MTGCYRWDHGHGAVLMGRSWGPTKAFVTGVTGDRRSLPVGFFLGPCCQMHVCLLTLQKEFRKQDLKKHMENFFTANYQTFSSTQPTPKKASSYDLDFVSLVAKIRVKGEIGYMSLDISLMQTMSRTDWRWSELMIFQLHGDAGVTHTQENMNVEFWIWASPEYSVGCRISCDSGQNLPASHIIPILGEEVPATVFPTPYLTEGNDWDKKGSCTEVLLPNDGVTVSQEFFHSVCFCVSGNREKVNGEGRERKANVGEIRKAEDK